MQILTTSEILEGKRLDVLGVKYPKMQILTTSEILEGKRFITPSVVGRTVKSPVLPLG